MNYTESIQYLYDRLPVFHHVGGAAYKPGLENTQRMMAILGHPHQAYKTIHVAGTNGKGSVSHFLSAILQAAGYKVGLYTSPHLVDFSERIKVNGTDIRKQYVVDFVQNHLTDFADIQPSFFEATMAMAFCYFQSEQVDVAIIEVGLGGRLDSTNVILPDLSVITNISFDHVAFLGNTLTAIAVEKAGIIKENTPVVIGETQSETEAVFRSHAFAKRADIYFSQARYMAQFYDYQGVKMRMLVNETDLLSIGLSGKYQLKNVVTVLQAVDVLRDLGYSVQREHVATGFADVVALTGFMGRWQQVQQRPSLVLDTAHNVAGIEAVVAQLRSIQCRTLRIVIGMVSDKDIDAALQLLPRSAHYYFTQANIQRALPAPLLRKQANQYQLLGKDFADVKTAVFAAQQDANADDFILICGSNFVVGEALVFLQ